MSCGRLSMSKIKRLITNILPEEKHNLIPCAVFGTAILLLGAANVIKWVIL